jgi:hypothetical protein
MIYKNFFISSFLKSCFIDRLLERMKYQLNVLKTPQNKIGFLLQYAYFKARKRFFLFSRFTQTHINHAAKPLVRQAANDNLLDINKILSLQVA